MYREQGKDIESCKGEIPSYQQRRKQTTNARKEWEKRMTYTPSWWEYN
jgi:hypothetical protein